MSLRISYVHICVYLLIEVFMLGSVYVSVWSCVYILEKESFNHTPGARYEKCITGGVQVFNS